MTLFKKGSTQKNRPIGILILVLLGLSFVAIINPILPIPQIKTANALSPQFILITTSFSVGGTVGVLNNWNPSALVGDEYIWATTCQPYTASITSITDTTGNVWVKIGSMQVAHGVVSDIWHTTQVPTGLGAITVTANFAATITFCSLAIYKSNQPVILTQTFSTQGTFRTSAIIGLVNKLNIQLIGGTITMSGTNQFVQFNYAFSNTSISGGTNFVTFTPLQPLIVVVPDALCDGVQNIVQCGTSETVDTPNGGTDTRRPTVTITNSIAATNTWAYGMFSLAFASLVLNPPSCDICSVNGGGTTNSKSTVFSTLTGNASYVYLADSPVGGVTIQNITTEVSSYTNAGAGKQHDFIYLCIYELPTLISVKPISSTNQLNTKTCLLDPYVSTGQTNQYIHWQPNYKVTPSVTFAWALFSRYSGLNIYTTNTTVTMYLDTADYSGTSGTPPDFLGNANPTTPPLWIPITGLGQQFTKSTGTFTFTNTNSTQTITTTATTTSLATSYIYSTTTGQDKISVIQDLTTFFPIWLLPLIFSPFGIQGVLIGSILGVIIGALIGVLPLWVAFLLSLGLVYILFRRGF